MTFMIFKHKCRVISAAPASIVLELKNLEHENITVIVSSRWAKLDFTWLVNKTVEKNVVFKDFDVLFLKCSD